MRVIYQEMPRRGWNGVKLDKTKGFFLEGKDYNDCIKQLMEWCENHKEKWVYFHDCGVAPSKPIPVARNVLEVVFFDAEPAAIMLFWQLFQKGCNRNREIDTMTAEQRTEMRKKHLKFFYMLGSTWDRKR